MLGSCQTHNGRKTFFQNSSFLLKAWILNLATSPKSCFPWSDRLVSFLRKYLSVTQVWLTIVCLLFSQLRWHSKKEAAGLASNNHDNHTGVFPQENHWSLYNRSALEICILRNLLFSSVTQSCPTFCHPMDCSTPWTPCPSPSPGVYSNSCPLSWWCHPTISFCHALLLLPSIFPSIRVFSSESVLHIRWPRYESFNFSISCSLLIKLIIFLCHSEHSNASSTGRWSGNAAGKQSLVPLSWFCAKDPAVVFVCFCPTSFTHYFLHH